MFAGKVRAEAGHPCRGPGRAPVDASLPVGPSPPERPLTPGRAPHSPGAFSCRNRSTSLATPAFAVDARAPTRVDASCTPRPPTQT